MGRAVAALPHREVAATLTVTFLGQCAVGVQGVDDPPRDLLEQGRVQFGRLLEEELLHPHLVLGLHRRRQRINGRGHDPGMGDGNRPRGLRGGDRREHRRQCLSGQPAPRTQIRSGTHPARRLRGTDPQ